VLYFPAEAPSVAVLSWNLRFTREKKKLKIMSKPRSNSIIIDPIQIRRVAIDDEKSKDFLAYIRVIRLDLPIFDM
jgi:hypothetical protein